MNEVIRNYVYALCLTVLVIALLKYVIPLWHRVFGYLYLFLMLRDVQGNVEEKTLMRIAAKMIRYKQVVNLLKTARKNPIECVNILHKSRELYKSLLAEGYTEGRILRASIWYLRQFREQGFNELPAQTLDVEITKIITVLEQAFSKHSEKRQILAAFCLLLNIPRLKTYMT